MAMCFIINFFHLIMYAIKTDAKFCLELMATNVTVIRHNCQSTGEEVLS